MGEVKVLGGTADKLIGGGVYEDTDAHKTLAERREPGSVCSAGETKLMGNIDVYGPRFFPVLNDWEAAHGSDSSSDRALLRAIALQALVDPDRSIVKPLLGRGARRSGRMSSGKRLKLVKRRQRAYAEAKFGRGGDSLRETLSLLAACFGAVLITSSGMTAIMVSLLYHTWSRR